MTPWQCRINRWFPVEKNPTPTKAELKHWSKTWLDLTLGGPVPMRTRLRLLLTGRLQILVQVKTDVHVSRAETRACCFVLPPPFLAKPQPPGFDALDRVLRDIGAAFGPPR